MKTLIYCHDAGPANIFKYNYADSPHCIFIAEGPAKDILDDTLNISNLYIPGFLNEFSSVILGTSVTNFRHLEIIQLAKRLSIPTACCLEHWKNYLQRFFCVKHQDYILPCQIIVYDVRAYDIALSLPELNNNCKIKIEKNNYLLEKVRLLMINYNSISLALRRPLFISEPISKFVSNIFPDEYESFELLLRHGFLNPTSLPICYTNICLHPSEGSSAIVKYESICKEYNVNARFYKSLNQIDFSTVSSVYGRDSMALVLTCLAKIPTYTVFSEDSEGLTIKEPLLRTLSLC